jgi:hypothetical protein
MKFAAKVSNTSVLHFNDLGADIKGVSLQEKGIALSPGQSVYLPDQSGVLYSATKGDAKRYAAAGLLDIDDSVAIGATVVLTHNFNIIPKVSVAKYVGVTWVAALVGTDYTATTNAAKTQTTIVNISGAILSVRLS